MAFSYSDENFTVIGNLCFVHILLDGKETSYDIPPAIVDRMLFNNIFGIYPYFSSNTAKDIGYAAINSGEIFLSSAGKGYLSFFFPIDSNK